jgi:hypothetical protein
MVSGIRGKRSLQVSGSSLRSYLAWLTTNDPGARMVTPGGDDYTREVFERQTKAGGPDEAHYRWRELQLAVAFDLLYRLLAAWRLKGKDAVRAFIGRLERFLKDELKTLIKLQDTVYGERRRAEEAARKTAGKITALEFLTPFDLKPLRRVREKVGQAIAAFTAQQVRQVRQTRWIKSKK